RLEADVDAVVAMLHLVARDGVAELTRRGSVQRAVVVAVPGTAQQPALDRSLPEWPALVRAGVVEGAVLAVVVRERDAHMPRRHRLDAALRKLVGLGDLEPAQAFPARYVLHQVTALPLERTTYQ